MKMSFQITTQTHALLVSFLCVKYFKTQTSISLYPNFAQFQHMCSFLHVLIKRVSKRIQFITLLFTAFQYHITFNLIFISYLFWHVAEIGMYQVYYCRILTYAVYATNEVVTILNGNCQTIVFMSWHVYESNC